ncbi:MAG: peptidylprolyl isomerase [Acidobacteriota bacterium]|nr:peptidylprolyl isomerase [Acidobacteriota bacterium]
MRLPFLFAAIFLFNFSSFAQETEQRVVDEVVAQVNEGVITLSRINKEINNRADALLARGQSGGKTREQIVSELSAKRNELIVDMINEELIIQQGKEMSLENEVEQEINQRFVQLMQRYNIKTMDELYKQIRAENVEPDELKAIWRRELIPALVFRYDVDGKIYNGLTQKELKDYFDKNREKFRKPETVTISEIFLSFAGRDENQVKAKAADLLRQLRAGANFETFVAQHSERPDSQREKGKVGTFEVPTLTEDIGKAVKDVKAGGYSEPIVIDEGVMILRVDQRVNDSATPVFNENQVRQAITMERSAEERKKYMSKLRNEAYIKIAKSYETAIMPILFKDDKKS